MYVNGFGLVSVDLHGKLSRSEVSVLESASFERSYVISNKPHRKTCHFPFVSLKPQTSLHSCLHYFHCSLANLLLNNQEIKNTYVRKDTIDPS